MQQNKKRSFGEWLEKEMRARRLSDRAMAELFARKDGEAGITHASVGRWRRGEAEPSPDNIEEICRILGVQPRLVYTLLGRIEPYETKSLTPQQVAIVEAVLSDLTEEEIGVLAANVDFFAARRKRSAQTPPAVPATSGGSA